MMKPRAIGLAVAGAALIADQASKLWLLNGFDLAARQPVALAPFVDLVLAWNRGISYSLFTTSSAWGPWVLLALTLAVTAGLVAWLWRIDGSGPAVALGLLVGGALGNAYDRFAYGAVVDFVHLHAGRFSWYIFNGADVAICAGVGVLLLTSWLPRSGASPASKLPENCV